MRDDFGKGRQVVAGHCSDLIALQKILHHNTSHTLPDEIIAETSNEKWHSSKLILFMDCFNAVISNNAYLEDKNVDKR